MKETKKVLSAAGVYVSLVLGAGFASGSELFAFFVVHGGKGVAGLIIAGAVLALAGWAVMDITVRNGVSGYDEFMSLILGKRASLLMVAVVNIFIGVMMATMFSGFAELAVVSFGMNYTAGVVIIAALCFIVFLFDLRGIVGISSALAPVLLIGGVFLGLYSVFANHTPVFLGLDAVKKSFLWAAVVYASYNIITAASVLSSMRETVGSRSAAKKAGLLSGLCLVTLGICFIAPMYINFDSLTGVSLPMLRIAAAGGGFVETVYIIVFVAAIFTTAVSSGFAVIEWLSGKLKINKIFIKIIVTISGAFLAHIGFSAFVEKAYPLFGYIGLFEIAVIIIYFLFGKNSASKKPSRVSSRRLRRSLPFRQG